MIECNLRKVRARVGVSDINRDFGSWQQNRTRVAAIGRIIKYPGYKKSLKGYLNPFNDIAIIKLSKTKGAKKVRIIKYEYSSNI